jgi:hypothetical protein
MNPNASAAARIWASSIAIAVLLSLSDMGKAWAIEIPPLSDLPSAIAAAHPELVMQREALVQEQEALGARARSHNSKCRAVEKGSAADASCIKALGMLAPIINSHIQARKQFNDNIHTAINLSARRNSPPGSETSMVNAGNVPSGLPKSLENAIATAYSDAPPGVRDRVRKGFYAVMDYDWKVAKAWFEDALKLNPGNAGLERLVALADSSHQSNQQPHELKPISVPATGPNLEQSNPNDSNLLFPDLKAMDDKQVQDFLSGPKAQPSASGQTFRETLERFKRIQMERRERGVPDLKKKLRRAYRNHPGPIGGSAAVDELPGPSDVGPP